ncbi:M48 family metalloprotease [Lysobacter terrae]
MTGLLLFIAAYFGLLGWFAWKAYRLMQKAADGVGGDGFWCFVGAVCAAFLAIFMVKALVFVKRRKAEKQDLELKAADQPELFAFLYRLADDAGAPRPHRVYLSPRVNAAVFYDLSIVNLILPSRKNLEIGLGLMNVLNLGEFKAVLAHEFGHFAQRSMAVGRWVYIAQQIAAHIVGRRDALDSFLQAVSRFDLRIAWVGWLLQLVIWSIRSLVELLFRVVVLAQRALSREMEYQADLVAASLAGSDAIVHSLHRLGGADDAWDRAIGFASNEANNGRPVKDLFAVQTRILEHMRTVLADAAYGESPIVPEGQAEQHRVFGKELARPPQMWSTHPANADREENVKRRYVAASIDPRPALLLLRNAEELRQRLSRDLFQGELSPAVPIEESLERLDQDFAGLSLDRRYRGTYLGRAPFREHENVDDIYAAPGIVADLHTELAALYSQEHGERLDQLRDLEQQRTTLEAVRDGYLAASGGVVHWRGSDVSKSELPRLIAELNDEIAALKRTVLEHDCRCRYLHTLAAGRVDAGWEAYLRGLAALLHYAEHAQANLRDAHGLLINTYEVVTADRNVSAKELRRLISAADEVSTALASIYTLSGGITYDERVAKRLGAARWTELLGDYRLPHPTQANIGEWLGAVDSWVRAAGAALSNLRSSALEALLESEDEVARALRDPSAALGPAPEAAQVPTHYPRLRPGTERKRQNKLGWWDRFQTAEGIGPTLARVAAAGGVVGAVLLGGAAIGTTELSIYNGLATPVRVSVDGDSVEVGPDNYASLQLSDDGQHQVETHSLQGGLIERFQSESASGARQIYNVAGAAALAEWTAVYGHVEGRSEKVLGTPRWSGTSAEFVFTEPPQQIQSSGQGGTRTVLSAFSNPQQLLGMLGSDAERATAIAAHARWDAEDSRFAAVWLWHAGAMPDFAAITADRLKRRPNETLTLRTQQDRSEGEAHKTVCAQQTALADAAPQAVDLQYLAIRCMEEGVAQDERFMAAHEKWPENGWLQMAAGYVQAQRMNWSQATALMESAATKLPVTEEWTALDTARIRRMMQGEEASLADLGGRSSFLQQLLALQGGVGTEGTPYAAYASLAKGELAAGLSQASHTDIENEILQLAAASDGASTQIVQQALRTPVNEKADDALAWFMLALASREHADLTRLTSRLGKAEVRDKAALTRFFEQVRNGADVAAAESALGSVDPRNRGIAYAMAVVMRGDRAPAAWRDGAKRLLFAAERPYFR